MSLRELSAHPLAGLLRAAAAAWVEDHAASMGAALAYYTTFSIAPLLLIVISVAGLAFGPDAARGEMGAQLQGLLGSGGAQLVEQLIERANRPAQGVLSTLLGTGLLLIGATTVFAELQDALDRIWRAPQRTAAGWWSLLRARLLSLGLVLALGFLMMVSLLLSAVLSALGKWWGAWFGHWLLLAELLNQAIGFARVTVIFAMIYKLMPRARVAWSDVWLGATTTALLFTAGKFLIGLYLGRSGLGSVFGASGSLVVLLVWVYYSAQIFLFGAEFTWAYARRHGSRRDDPQRPPASP